MTKSDSSVGPAKTSSTGARPPVLVFGTPPPHALNAIALGAVRAGTTAVVEASARQAAAWLEQNRPLAVVVDGATAGAKQACQMVRAEPMLANVPIISVVETCSDEAFADVFAWGGDDVAVRGSVGSIADRLSAIPEAGEVPYSRGHGIAVVADPDPSRRLLTGRVLRNAGYSVTFAGDSEETIAEAAREGVVLVVSSAALENEAGPALAARAREAGSKAAWLVGMILKEAPRIRPLMARERAHGVATYDASGPSENVLFVANELLRAAHVGDARASARLLFGTSVRFRLGGGDEDEIGYTYNVSAGGLYVRTLVPLARGSEAWIELRPPGGDRRVRLEGQVAWSRRFGPNDIATVPPGFGFQIADTGLGQLERYVRCYRAFAAEVAGAWG